MSSSEPVSGGPKPMVTSKALVIRTGFELSTPKMADLAAGTTVMLHETRQLFTVRTLGFQPCCFPCRVSNRTLFLWCIFCSCATASLLWWCAAVACLCIWYPVSIELCQLFVAARRVRNR